MNPLDHYKMIYRRFLLAVKSYVNVFIIPLSIMDNCNCELFCYSRSVIYSLKQLLQHLVFFFLTSLILSPQRGDMTILALLIVLLTRSVVQSLRNVLWSYALEASPYVKNKEGFCIPCLN